MTLELLDEVKNNSTDLNSNIAAYILSIKQEYSSLTATKVANECHVSNSYITNFVKKLGYGSFNEFKIELIKEVNQSEKRPLNLESFEIHDYANEVINTLVNTTRIFSEKEIKQVAKIINEANEVQLFGIGGSAVVCEDFYVKMIGLKKNVKFERDESLRRRLCKNATDKTVAIIFSYSGPGELTRECIDILGENNALIVLVTRSTKDYKEDIKINISSSETIVRNYTMFSRIGLNFISDLIYLYMLKEE